jgi:hypothetical protein
MSSIAFLHLLLHSLTTDGMDVVLYPPATIGPGLEDPSKIPELNLIGRIILPFKNPPIYSGNKIFRPIVPI